jgi:hypothetical protein
MAKKKVNYNKIAEQHPHLYVYFEKSEKEEEIGQVMCKINGTIEELVVSVAHTMQMHPELFEVYTKALQLYLFNNRPKLDQDDGKEEAIAGATGAQG